MAAHATASATAGATPGSSGEGTTVPPRSRSGVTRSARALAAARFMPSLTRLARTSSAPRKMPGNPRTLLIWLG